MKSETPQLADKQKVLLRASFPALIPIWESLSDHLYSDLFETHPDLRALFPADIRMQGDRLTMMLAMAVDLLNDEPGLIKLCEECGLRHKYYGTEASHYPVVIALMAKHIDDQPEMLLTQDSKDAWKSFLVFIVHHMISGAGQAT